MEKISEGDMTHSCVILANGSFPKGERALSFLRRASYICCCDGAVAKLVSAGLTPSVIVGDGDSIPDELRKRFSNIFIQLDEQDHNDLTKATEHCFRQGFTDIVYLGATGLREDHTIGNIFLLPFYLEKFGVRGTMVTDEGFFVVAKGRCTIDARVGQQVSVFNINCENLSSEGLKWPLYPFQQLWQGTLNEAIAAEFSITGDGIYLVFLQD